MCDKINAPAANHVQAIRPSVPLVRKLVRARWRSVAASPLQDGPGDRRDSLCRECSASRRRRAECGSTTVGAPQPQYAFRCLQMKWERAFFYTSPSSPPFLTEARSDLRVR